MHRVEQNPQSVSARPAAFEERAGRIGKHDAIRPLDDRVDVTSRDDSPEHLLPRVHRVPHRPSARAAPLARKYVPAPGCE
jgi:hypothetical protein